MGNINVVVYSGGMDSFTLLNGIVRAHGADTVTALSFDYGQRHKKELDYAARVCKELNVQHTIINLAAVTPLLVGSALTSPEIDVPEGHYEEESMRQTVVPGRNTMMLGLALAAAESKLLQIDAKTAAVRKHVEGAGYQLDRASAVVWYGAHSGDHHIYPDCRPKYVTAMQEVYLQATEGRVQLMVPFLHGNKETILQSGFEMGLDYAKSWTCYKGGDVPCGKCGSCQERALAFAAIGKVDPAYPV